MDTVAQRRGFSQKSSFSRDPVMAKGAGGKTGKYRGKYLRKKGITADEDFWDRKDEAMETALREKFTQNKLPRDILKATQNAKLVHFRRGLEPEVWNHLMKIRKEIKTI